MSNMYVTYLRAVTRHKWYVFIECCRAGIPLRGLLHDMSKFLPSEFIPYARYFYGEQTPAVCEAFDLAWLRHQKRNPHHWQWWILSFDDGGMRIFPMSEHIRLEMLCDWRGAGKAYGKNDTPGWYRDNREKMKLHEDTRAWIESELGFSLTH